MRALGFLVLLAAPFWETKEPRAWSEEELRKITEDSPWAQIAHPVRTGVAPGVQVYLASATPMREAEAEFARRRKIASDVLREEYEQFLREDRGRSVVLAAFLPDQQALAAGEESRRMEDESLMKVGRKEIHISGHFPPTSTDPYLRLVFPRGEAAKAKVIAFELYLPGVPSPYRQVEFAVKDLVYRGQTDF
jgi:hypothetical protein